MRNIKERFGDSVESIRFDFSVPETYAKTFEGVEKMFLMRPPHISNVNREMFPAIDAAKHAGIKHVVFLSLIGIERAKFVPYRNPNPLHFLFETLRRGTPFTFAIVMMGLYTSTRFGMAESVTNEVLRLTGRKPTSFKQYTEDYRDAWL
jgi:hypothetical protein